MVTSSAGHVPSWPHPSTSSATENAAETLKVENLKIPRPVLATMRRTIEVTELLARSYSSQQHAVHVPNIAQASPNIWDIKLSYLIGPPVTTLPSIQPCHACCGRPVATPGEHQVWIQAGQGPSFPPQLTGSRESLKRAPSVLPSSSTVT